MCGLGNIAGIRNIVIRVLVLLLFGAIVNIAVAWGCAMYSNIWSKPRYVPQFGTDTPTVWVCFGCQLIIDETPILRAHHLSARRFSPEIDTRSYGWPCLSTQSIVQGYVDAIGWVSGWDLPWDELRRRGFPTARLPKWMHASTTDRLTLVPIWPSFAINTIFYAAILWMFFAGPAVLRRKRRLRRGLCPACAYPIGSNDLCTECGTAVPLRHPREVGLAKLPASS